MKQEVPKVEDVQKLLSRGPFHQWLGLNVVAVGDGTIELRRPARFRLCVLQYSRRGTTSRES